MTTTGGSIASSSMRRTAFDRGSSLRVCVDEYFRELEPLFTELRGECDRLLTVNQDAMRRKASEAATLARRWFVTTLWTALIAGDRGHRLCDPPVEQHRQSRCGS